MPRIRQLASKYATKDFLKEARVSAAGLGIFTIQGIADRSGIAYRTMQTRFKTPESLRFTEAMAMVNTLNMSNEQILRCFGRKGER